MAKKNNIEGRIELVGQPMKFTFDHQAIAKGHPGLLGDFLAACIPGISVVNPQPSQRAALMRLLAAGVAKEHK